MIGYHIVCAQSGSTHAIRLDDRVRSMRKGTSGKRMVRIQFVAEHGERKREHSCLKTSKVHNDTYTWTA